MLLRTASDDLCPSHARPMDAPILAAPSQDWETVPIPSMDRTSESCAASEHVQDSKCNGVDRDREEKERDAKQEAASSSDSELIAEVRKQAGSRSGTEQASRVRSDVSRNTCSHDWSPGDADLVTKYATGKVTEPVPVAVLRSRLACNHRRSTSQRCAQKNLRFSQGQDR